MRFIESGVTKMANEKRLDLIDRQAFIDDIKTEIVNLRLNGLKGTPRPCDELSAFIDRIEEQPGVDAVVLPCKIGDDVYEIPSKVNFKLNVLSKHEENNRVYHQKVESITFTKDGWYMTGNVDKEYGTGRIYLDRFYKEIWFLTQKEAEIALAKMDGDGNVV